MPNSPRPQRRRRTGRDDLDALIAQAVEAVGSEDADLLAESLATVLRMGLDGTDRGDLKMIAGALHELRRSFQVFEPYRARRKVTVFGSARVQSGSEGYEQPKAFAALMAAHDWMVITGGGPGVMQAANEGAGRPNGFGLNIRLPFEQHENPWVDEHTRLVIYRHFFTRKVTFVKEASAFAFFPGGFGTMDEAFETLTLIQTGKSPIQPIVLIDAEGDGYWNRWLGWLRAELLDAGLISAQDLSLIRHTHDPAVAVQEICGFYANYRSMRYVDGRLYLRLTRAPEPALVAELNDEFGDICRTAPLRVVPAHPDEVADADELDAARVELGFDRHSFGRLRLLIDRLNRI